MFPTNLRQDRGSATRKRVGWLLCQLSQSLAPAQVLSQTRAQARLLARSRGDGHSGNVSIASDVPGKVNELATSSSSSNLSPSSGSRAGSSSSAGHVGNGSGSGDDDPGEDRPGGCSWRESDEVDREQDRVRAHEQWEINGPCNEEEQDDANAVIHKQEQSQRIEALKRSLPPDELSISFKAGVQHFLSQRSEALESQEQDRDSISRSNAGPGSRASTQSSELEVFLQKEMPTSNDQALCDTWLDKESNSASVLASATEGIPPPMFCNFQNVHQLK